MNAEKVVATIRKTARKAAEMVEQLMCEALAEALVTVPKRHRTSAADIASQKQLAFTTAKSFRGRKFSKSEVMQRSGSTVDLGRVLGLLVADGKLRKHGDRRLTTYEVVGKAA